MSHTYSSIIKMLTSKQARLAGLLLAGAALTGCTSNFKDFKEIFSIGSDATFKRYKLPPLKEERQVFAPITVANQKVKPVVSVCRPASAAEHPQDNWPGVLMILPDAFPLKSGSFCADPLVQAFLGHGYSVIRSYFIDKDNKTIASLDHWGEDTVERSLAAIAMLAKDKQLKVVGTMGYGGGAIASLQVAQRLEGLDFAIAGNGIYDLEKAFAQGIGPEIEALKASDLRTSDEEFLERRSIAWDYMTLPKKVALYHGQLNQQISPEHAESFRDSLQASEFKVHFELIKNQGHNIEPVVHQRYLDVLLGDWPIPAKERKKPKGK